MTICWHLSDNFLTTFVQLLATFLNILATFSELPPNLLTTFSQLFHNILTNLSQIYHNFLNTFSQLCHNFLTYFLQLCPTFVTTFSQSSHNFLTTFSQRSQNFLTTFSQLSHNFHATEWLFFFNAFGHSPIELVAAFSRDWFPSVSQFYPSQFLSRPAALILLDINSNPLPGQSIMIFSQAWQSMVWSICTILKRPKPVVRVNPIYCWQAVM